MAEQRRGGSDVDIIVSLQEEDPTAGLRLLEETYAGKVRGWLKKKYRCVLDDLQIEAALNTATYQIWKFAPDYDESKGTLGGCYVVFARNAAASILRGEQKHYTDRVDFEQILEGKVAGNEPCDDPPPSPKLEQLVAALNTFKMELPPLERLVYEADLKADGKASAPDLAEKIGKPANSILVARHRYKEKLQKRMTDLGFYRS